MRLLTLNYEGVQKLIESMENEVKAIKKNAFSVGWYSRGSISYEDALNLSSEDREIFNKIIDENLETTKKSQMPFF